MSGTVDKLGASDGHSPTESVSLKEAEDQRQIPSIEDEFPDGGLKAWMTVTGAWFILFGTYGYVYAFGVYQDRYTRIYITNKTPSQISWIGTLQYTMPFVAGVVSGKLFDQGTFYTLELLGSTLFVVSLFLLSLAKPNHYYQIFLSQGLGMGLGLGLVFIPTLSVITHHFRRKRALATGIAFSGSALGAIIFPIMLNQQFEVISFGAAVRNSAYVVLACVVVGNLLMRTRYPKGPKPPPPIGEFFKEVSYLVFILGGTLACLGLLFPAFYIQLYAVEHELDLNLAFYTIAIINAASVFGRVFGTYLADFVGPINVLTPCVGGLALSNWLMLTIHDSASLVIVSIIYGFFSGGFLALAFASLASLAKHPSHTGSKTGLAFAISSIALLGSEPAHGALLTPMFKWIRPISFAGAFTTAATFVFVAVRHLVAKEKGRQRV